MKLLSYAWIHASLRSRAEVTSPAILVHTRGRECSRLKLFRRNKVPYRKGRDRVKEEIASLGYLRCNKVHSTFARCLAFLA